MRHKNRIILRLRHERNQLREQVRLDARTYENLTASIQQYSYEHSPQGALKYVRYVEQKNLNQTMEIERLEEIVESKNEEMEQMRTQHALSMGLVTIFCFASVIGVLIYHYLTTH